MSDPSIAVKACQLVSIDLHNADEFAELQRQRKTCGWSCEEAVLLKWRETQDKRLKNMFWIVIPDPSSTTPGSTVRTGHVCLDAYADPPDPELAAADKSILTIQHFFILPEHRGGGLGRATMDLIEAMAKTEPYGSKDCKFITLNTASKRYFEEGGPEWKELFTRYGEGMWSKQVWYEKRGYVQWKEELRILSQADDGRVVPRITAFLRKPLQ